MKLIGIAGPAGAGKDTVADFLVNRYGYTKLSMASLLKAGLTAMGFPEPRNRDDKEKPIPGFDFTWREAAQKLGTEWGRSLDPDIWIKAMTQRCRRSQDRIVISDIRFENEAAMVRKEGGVLLHLYGRAVDLGDNAVHISEAGLVINPDKDGIIDNSGELSDTEQQVIHYLVLGGDRRFSTGAAK